TTACISTVRGRPPGLALGIKLDNSSHCSWVKLLGYDDVMALKMLSDNLLLTGYRFESFPGFSDIL
ncbi:hypothetical protein H6F66_24800, partial [Trichocoleus sp. FACHB-6]|nr:hypothetical protein [Trichocoleus sp. FACHB-832]MBD2065444.1 hypothetical protein [Trichocoleus sp. FACHB-6]